MFQDQHLELLLRRIDFVIWHLLYRFHLDKVIGITLGVLEGLPTGDWCWGIKQQVRFLIH